MCAPKIPDPTPVPQRQAARSPDGVESGDRMAERLRRRMGYAAAVANGSMGAPTTTASPVTGTTGTTI